MIINSDLVCAGANWEEVGIEETAKANPPQIENAELDYENLDEQDEEEDAHIDLIPAGADDEDEGVLINPTPSVPETNRKNKNSMKQKKRD